MNTRIQKINPEVFEDEELSEVAQVLADGGLVAFPTETVYGLGADALNPTASERIYAAKGRPSDNPLIIHIADMEDLYQIADEVNEKAKKLAEAFWPGPLTMIFQKTERVPKTTTGGLDTVAVRMPSHPIALALIRISKKYIAAPSANTSGRPSPTKATHVMEDLDGRIDWIIDGQQVGIGIESTIVDMTEEIPVILRPGYITKEMMEELIGTVKIDPALLVTKPDKNLVAKAPGMKYRHYAPKGKLTIIEGEEDNVIKKINDLVSIGESEQKKVAVIATEETKGKYKCNHVFSIGSRKSEGSIAAGLYDILRTMDSIEAQCIYAESFETDKLGHAIMNRMLKAAGYDKVQV